MGGLLDDLGPSCLPPTFLPTWQPRSELGIPGQTQDDAGPGSCPGHVLPLLSVTARQLHWAVFLAHDQR